MSIKNLNPYINFNGDAAQAIKLYESVLGARTENLQRFADIPASLNVGAESRDRIVHARLLIGDGVIMISDAPADVKVPVGGNAHIILHFDDVADMTQKFEALSQGGKVTMPLQDTFWGARFGMLTDAHGVRWMFSFEHKKA